MKTKTKASPSLKPLSAEEQVRLRVLWDQRLRDSHAMIPRKARAGGITATEARMSNALLGKFADSYMKLVLRRMQVIHRNRKCKQEKIVLAVGYGRGDGSRWLRQASMAGYKTGLPVCSISVV